MQFFQEIFKPAWKIAWKNKFLWLFGFFATALGAGSNYETVAQALDVVTGKSAASLPSMALFWQSGYLQAFSFGNIARFASEEPLNLLLVTLTLLLGLCFFGILVWLVFVSLGSLIYGVREISKGSAISLGEAFHAGRENFWKLFTITLEAKIAILAALFIVSIPLYLILQKNNVFVIGFFLAAFVILVIFTLIISFTAFYASAFAVLKNQSVSEAWISGYHLFKNNWLVSIEMAILILVLYVLFGISFVAAAVLLSIPFTVLAFTFFYLALPAGIIATQILSGLLLFAGIILATSLFTAFEIASWTLVFLKLQKKTQSALERVAASLAARIRQ